jgi:hypothetical protein
MSCVSENRDINYSLKNNRLKIIISWDEWVKGIHCIYTAPFIPWLEGSKICCAAELGATLDAAATFSAGAKTGAAAPAGRPACFGQCALAK